MKLKLRIFVLTALALGCLLALPARATPDPALHALFEQAWEQGTRNAPEAATIRGDHRYNDRLSQRSPAAIAATDAQARELLQQARAIDASRLDETDRVSLALFIDRQAGEVEMQRFEGWRTLSIGSLSGFQTSLSNLLRQTPVSSEAQVRQLLARLAAYPLRVEQELARLRQGMAQGWVSGRPVLERSLAQLEGQLTPELERSPLFEPFTRLDERIAPELREMLRGQGLALLRDQVYPAQRALARFIRAEYLPKAPPDGALTRYPEGADVYAALVKRNTTLPLPLLEQHIAAWIAAEQRPAAAAE